VIASQDEMLLETFPRGARFHMVLYPFEGRIAHSTLAMLLTRRLDRLGVALVLRLKRYGEKRAFAALSRLLASPGATERARALAPAMTRDDGPAIIASWVAERLAHHPDDHRLVA
jgi:hypothetical protein